MARKRKKTVSATKKVVAVGATLIVIQILILLLIGGPKKTVSTMQAVNEKVKGLKDISDSRKDQIRVQMAVGDYMSKHNGKAPESLRDLIPEYFSSIPNDPTTKEPFEYKVVSGQPRIGHTGPTEGQLVPATGSTTLDPKNLTPDQQEQLIAMLTDTTAVAYVYDPTGKRDPFKPFSISRPVVLGETELEKAPISSFRLSAVMGMGAEATAIVEDPTGHGYRVNKGTKIGVRGGEVVEILPDRVVVLEVTEDFTGNKHNQQFEMKLRSEGEPNKGKSSNPKRK